MVWTPWTLSQDLWGFHRACKLEQCGWEATHFSPALSFWQVRKLRLKALHRFHGKQSWNKSEKFLAKPFLLVSRYLALVLGKNSNAFVKLSNFSIFHPYFTRCSYVENLLSLHLLPSLLWEGTLIFLKL